MSQKHLNQTNFKLLNDEGVCEGFSFDLEPESKTKLKKTATVYYSKHYKNNVLKINLDKHKSFYFTRSMWKNFRQYYQIIDNALLKQRDSPESDHISFTDDRYASGPESKRENYVTDSNSKKHENSHRQPTL
jgi:hypothetical protein